MKQSRRLGNLIPSLNGANIGEKLVLTKCDWDIGVAFFVYDTQQSTLRRMSHLTLAKILINNANITQIGKRALTWLTLENIANRIGCIGLITLNLKLELHNY